jgi:hypothetical protein
VILRPSPIRTGITWGVAALFAAVMVCGEGLHFLPGFDHSEHAATCCCGHLGDFSSGDAAHTPSSASLAAAADHESHATGSTCVICSFFAQAHCLPVALIDIDATEHVVDCCAAAADVSAIAFFLAYHSRAPPSVGI